MVVLRQPTPETLESFFHHTIRVVIPDGVKPPRYFLRECFSVFPALVGPLEEIDGVASVLDEPLGPIVPH